MPMALVETQMCMWVYVCECVVCMGVCASPFPVSVSFGGENAQSGALYGIPKKYPIPGFFGVQWDSTKGG
jgi:hypothetical protein